jgi:hypothetical protein
LGAGVLCDVLRKRIRQPEPRVLFAALLISFSGLLTIVFVNDRTLALVSLFVLNSCAYAFLGPVVTLIQTEATPATRALALAVGVAISNILNLGIALPAVGAISDALKLAYGARAVGYALAVGACITALLGLFAYVRVRRA